jgi:hypothetical protein
MRLQYFAVAGLAVGLFAATPVLAQSKSDESKQDTQAAAQQPGSDSASDQDSGSGTEATKQHTQAGANFRPPVYGTPYRDRQEGFKQ